MMQSVDEQQHEIMSCQTCAYVEDSMQSDHSIHCLCEHYENTSF